ncbi:MAG TPA: hypothetical protein VFA46_17730 [Actinomycetes bacterium]|jgi:hypothetical protein|nr:hypothetical protein [Actinomycetes bacterium]
MPLASSDAVFDFLRVCRNGVQFKLGVRSRQQDSDSAERRLRAMYRRIQAAAPPPTRDGRPWELGIRVKDGTEDGQPLRVEDGDDSWKQQGVFHLEGLPSLDQPAPSSIVLDRWLAVPAAQASPTTLTFTNEVDQRGFLSASYPQPHIGEEGVTRVGVAYFDQYTFHWTRELPPGAWVAISFDRFWPPERHSVEYIAQVEDRMLPPPPG